MDTILNKVKAYTKHEPNNFALQAKYLADCANVLMMGYYCVMQHDPYTFSNTLYGGNESFIDNQNSEQ